MGIDIPKVNHTPTAAIRSNPGILLALLIALGLHGLILLLPLPKQETETSPVPAQIELQLTRFELQPELEDIYITDPESPHPPVSLPAPIAQDKPVPLAKTSSQVVAPSSTVRPLTPIRRDFEHMNTAERTRLTHTILSSQFITEESAADQLFGPAIARYSIENRKDFHYPGKANLVTMLDQPMQELPFEYTPGLIHFAYAPGVKGDLQRFWDVITPEFGMITDHGTEIRCIWVLIIAACGWK